MKLKSSIFTMGIAGAFLFLAPNAQAASLKGPQARKPAQAMPTPNLAGKNSGGKVLDFSAEMIEGEMIRPRLFLELSTKADFAESSLYVRDDFNDFHASDAKNRLRYIEPVEAE